MLRSGSSVELDVWMTDLVGQGTLPFAMTVIKKHDDVAYWRWCGLAQPTREVPPEPNMLLRFYSMTKPVTSLMALLLEQQGMINLGEPAEKLVPELCSIKVLSIRQDP